MDISQLRTVLAVQRTGSLTRTGELVHLSPSAVYCQIHQLEDELGRKLYNRTGKRIILTPAGESLAKYAQTLVDTHDMALASMRQGEGGGSGLLRIGCGPHSSVRILPFLLNGVFSVEPKIEIRVTTADDTCLLSGLKSGSTDAVLMTLPVSDGALSEEPLWSFEQVLVLPSSSEMDEIPSSLKDLSEQPFILYRRGPVIESWFAEMRHTLGFQPHVVVEHDEVDSIKEMIRLGMGVSLLPYWSVGDDERAGRFKIVRLRNSRRYNYGLLYRNSGFEPTTLPLLRRVAHKWLEWWPLAPYIEPPLPKR